MFNAEFRASLRDDLIAFAQSGDSGVDAAALVGSAARGEEDQWSDIDLALRVAGGGDVASTADLWSGHLASRASVVDELDIQGGQGVYRVFLLEDGLQVDLSFWPAGAFASNGEPFELIFGSSDRVLHPGTDVDASSRDIGYAWLYALHIRSALGRERLWQAAEMLDGMRGHVIALACRRHAIPSHQGRGVDQLPDLFKQDLALTRPVAIQAPKMTESFRHLARLLLAETTQVDPARSERLSTPLIDLL